MPQTGEGASVSGSFLTRSIAVIGGPAGAGKSTTARLLAEAWGGVSFRMADCYFELASTRGCAREDAFMLVEPLEAEALAVEKCRDATAAVIDCHYAIQPHRDSALALGEASYDDWVRTAMLEAGELEEEYQAALTVRFGLELHRVGTTVGVLLSAAPEELYERATIRPRRAVRNRKLEQVSTELRAEAAQWQHFTVQAGLPALELRTDYLAPGEVVRRINSFLS